LTIKLTPYTEFRSSGAHSHPFERKRTLCYPSDIQLSKISRIRKLLSAFCEYRRNQ
jgi:hypothetical protein